MITDKFDIFYDEIKNTCGALLSIDFGLKNVGIAVSDTNLTIATPLIVLNNDNFLVDKICLLLKEYKCIGIVSGWPIDLNGNVHKIGENILFLCGNLFKKTNLPVLLWDESMSTKNALNKVYELNTVRGDKFIKKIGKGKDDHLAAQFILTNILYLNTIKNFTNTSWFKKNDILQVKMSIGYDLNNMKNACIEAGDIHKKMKNVIHIAGTNGKGSTVAFLKSILTESGYKVNTTTSPHLVRFNERINLNGTDISDEHINRILDQYENIIQKYELSFFEKSIFVAFVAFSESDADFNIIETGLGGTLDATNVIGSQKICVITAISKDHCAILGNTIKEIAANKLGIINKNDKVVIGYQEYDLGHKLDDNFYVGGKNWFVNKEVKLGLLGDHQYYNAANAVAVCDLLRLDKYLITDDNIKNGLEKTKWIGRLDRVNNLIIDGSHNIDGINSLCDYLNGCSGKKIGIMAIMKDKDVDEICQRISAIFEYIYCVDIDNAFSDRAMKPSNLAVILEKNNIKSIVNSSLKELLNKKDIIESENVVIFGSLFLVSDYYRLFV